MTESIIEIDEQGTVHFPLTCEACGAPVKSDPITLRASFDVLATMRARDALWCRALIATLDTRQTAAVLVIFNRQRED